MRLIRAWAAESLVDDWLGLGASWHRGVLRLFTIHPDYLRDPTDYTRANTNLTPGSQT